MSSEQSRLLQDLASSTTAGRRTFGIGPLEQPREQLSEKETGDTFTFRDGGASSLYQRPAAVLKALRNIEVPLSEGWDEDLDSGRVLIPAARLIEALNMAAQQAKKRRRRAELLAA